MRRQEEAEVGPIFRSAGGHIGVDCFVVWSTRVESVGGPS